jgi:hypothetical protein
MYFGEQRAFVRSVSVIYCNLFVPVLRYDYATDWLIFVVFANFFIYTLASGGGA